MDTDDTTRILVEEALQTGLMLTDVASRLIDALPEDAFPGEDPAAVLIEMVTGSLRPVTAAAPPGTVEAAIALLGAVRDRVIIDLRQAADLAAR
jgi:hypothetical protein